MSGNWLLQWKPRFFNLKPLLFRCSWQISVKIQILKLKLCVCRIKVVFRICFEFNLMPMCRGPVCPFWRRYSTLETLPSLRGDVRELAPTVKAALFQNLDRRVLTCGSPAHGWVRSTLRSHNAFPRLNTVPHTCKSHFPANLLLRSRICIISVAE